jgi:hypothetical protein
MRRRLAGTQHADQSKDASAETDLRCHIAPEGARQGPSLRVACIQSRREPQPVGRGDRKHRCKQDDLRRNHVAVAGCRESLQAAHHHAAIEKTGDRERTHDNDPHAGESPGGRGSKWNPRGNVATRARQNGQQRQQAAYPERGGRKMQRLHRDVQRRAGGGMSGPHLRHQHEGGKRSSEPIPGAPRPRATASYEVQQHEQHERQADQPHMAEARLPHDDHQDRRAQNVRHWHSAYRPRDEQEPEQPGDQRQDCAPQPQARKPAA